MDQLEKHSKDLKRLYQLYLDSSYQQWPRLAAEMRGVLAIRPDGTLEPGRLKRFAASYWNKYGKSDIRRVQREVRLLAKLAPLFKQLSHGSNRQLEKYAFFRVEFAFSERQFKRLINKWNEMVKSGSLPSI